MSRLLPKRCDVSPRDVVRRNWTGSRCSGERCIEGEPCRKERSREDLLSEIRALRRGKAELRAALRPIVEAAYAKDDLDHDTMNPQYHIEVTITVAEARAAKKALASKARGARRKA